jgi:dTDP-4-dehydrorhamnose 3,5-epimerase
VKISKTSLPGVLLIEPEAFADHRGFFLESYHREKYAAVGVAVDFVQDSISYSDRGVLRGLHYQTPNGQGKLVSVSRGAVIDVAVDIREGSPTFLKHHSTYLSAENRRQLWIPEGFAHGFCVTSKWAEFHYKCTRYYDPTASCAIRWNDPDLGIDWPVRDPILSESDRRAPLLAEALLSNYEGEK